MADRYRVTALDLAPVPEGQKRRVERDAKLLEEKKAAKAAQRKQARDERVKLEARTHEYNKEYAALEKSVIDAKRAAKAEGGFYKEAEAKVLFVMRIKGVNKIAPKPRKVFQLMRLLQIHNGVFIKVNKATTEMLKHIEPFVAYGYPTVSTIRKLLYKRGYVRVGKLGARQRVRIQHNETISAALGQYGIHGVEDMVHEIATAGPHFKQVTNFLWTFKLKAPRHGFVCKRHGFAEFRKGDWGNRETKINELVNRMI
eukprot:Gregarina_sp_Pseudo_9__2327@NODE_2640_length_925_cov_322_156885_g2421_i0_p1_GENE_NODE_2640_length_925_cov_322_156885_g2421_i0NODE_2640_length_925_cov_322_156885_g2421_i0_p1_ORF_typecomplete_len256_score72_37Ribosomal_L30/PF00327_20/9_2e21Ribosomal_L30_N/PF08079_12/1_7e09DUF4303/PF14136_6/0_053AAA_13/PF13166_6/0_19OstA_2/PF13100_6/0_32OstA_2/PF13100_6/6_3e03DUF4407/PF14362_6/0_29Macoilin/PF09726_9/0_53HCMV_UL139/PF12507_8/1_6Casc1_N/PF15927_5/1_2e02Casc1_N/PF15927_5/89_NODE_2640_length_925_cov_32